MSSMKKTDKENVHLYFGVLFTAKNHEICSQIDTVREKFILSAVFQIQNVAFTHLYVDISY